MLYCICLESLITWIALTNSPVKVVNNLIINLDSKELSILVLFKCCFVYSCPRDSPWQTGKVGKPLKEWFYIGLGPIVTPGDFSSPLREQEIPAVCHRAQS